LKTSPGKKLIRLEMKSYWRTEQRGKCTIARGNTLKPQDRKERENNSAIKSHFVVVILKWEGVK